MRYVALLCAALLTLGLIQVAQPVSASAMMSAATSARVMSAARTRAGATYAYGGVGPWRFDCSGLTRWAYARVGKSLPHSSAAQARYGVRVSRSAARPGDLVFFTGRGGVYHVALYAGRGRVFHASHPGRPVGYERLWTSAVFFKRLH